MVVGDSEVSGRRFRFVKTQPFHNDVVGQIVFLCRINRHRLRNSFLWLWESLHQSSKALFALRPEDGIGKGRVSELNIKCSNVFNDERLAILQIDGIADLIWESLLCGCLRRFWMMLPDMAGAEVSLKFLPADGDGVFAICIGKGIEHVIIGDLRQDKLGSAVSVRSENDEVVVGGILQRRQLCLFHSQPLRSLSFGYCLSDFFQVAFCLPFAREFLCDAFLVHIVSIVQIVPYCIAGFCLDQGKAFIRFHRVLCGGLLCISEHFIDRRRRLRLVLFALNFFSGNLTQPENFYWGKKAVLMDELCNPTLYLWPAQGGFLICSGYRNMQGLVFRAAILSRKPCGSASLPFMFFHIPHNSPLAFKTAVPRPQRLINADFFHSAL